jgi:SAM-dependent MidA family methyltransferase
VGSAEGATGGGARPGLTALSDLKQKIVRLIEASGPLSIADYMAICLYDPDGGYYMKREPFGVAGDFTTAPEVSQMFGELIAVWLYSTWRTLGSPSPLAFVEIGPGRGTMMKDMLRVLGREEVEAILAEQGEVVIRNEMCNHEYRFDAKTIEELFARH